MLAFGPDDLSLLLLPLLLLVVSLLTIVNVCFPP